MNEDIQAFLEHVGVKGMRWGQRKARPTRTITVNDRYSGTKGKIVIPKSTGSKRENRKIEKLKKTARPPASKLTDEQLRKAINRMQMEKQYSSLIPQNKTTAKKVVGFISGVGSTAVKGSITGLATQQVGNALKKAIKTG